MVTESVGKVGLVGRVCVVMERHQATGRTTLYGVFTDEESARANYGEQIDPYDVMFEAQIPLFGRLDGD